MADKRPHIILITTDQQRGDCLGIEGHPVLQTPTSAGPLMAPLILPNDARAVQYSVGMPMGGTAKRPISAEAVVR